jgi:hypothetical protein
MTFLVLSASTTVVIGLLWLLRRLIASSADDSVSMRGRHRVTAALLFAASLALIVYLTW